MRTIISALLCFLSALQAVQTVDELKEQVCEILPRLEGWCSKEKAIHFIDLVIQEKPSTCVEIGAFGGSSIFPVASALKFLGNGVVIAIDPWDKVECLKNFDPTTDIVHIKWWGNLNMPYIHYSYINMLDTYNLRNYCITMKMTSEKAASQIDMIDILYIDGSPSEEGTIKDVNLYLPKVRPGGFIWINDCSNPKKAKALQRLFENCELVKLIDNQNCALLKKNKQNQDP